MASHHTDHVEPMSSDKGPTKSIAIWSPHSSGMGRGM